MPNFKVYNLILTPNLLLFTRNISEIRETQYAVKPIDSTGLPWSVARLNAGARPEAGSPHAHAAALVDHRRVAPGGAGGRLRAAG